MQPAGQNSERRQLKSGRQITTMGGFVLWGWPILTGTCISLQMGQILFTLETLSLGNLGKKSRQLRCNDPQMNHASTPLQKRFKMWREWPAWRAYCTWSAPARNMQTLARLNFIWIESTQSAKISNRFNSSLKQLSHKLIRFSSCLQQKHAILNDSRFNSELHGAKN